MAHSASGGDRIIKCAVQYDPYIPEVPVHQYLLERMQENAERIAMVDIMNKKEWTYSQLSDNIQRLSAALQTDLGLTKGQFVALVLPNCPEFIVSLLSVTRCGGIASMVNPAYTPRELKHVASIIRPSLWICIKEFLPAIKQLGYTTRAIVLDLTGNREASEWYSLLQYPPSRKPFIPPYMDVKKDLATMPFSSGTTGLPKGVMLSHHNLVTALCQFKVWCPYDKSDINLGLLPMFHQYGCLIGLTTLSVGARLVTIPKFSFPEMLQAIQNYRISMIPLVPPIALLLSKHPIVDQYDLSSVKGLISSAAPLSLDIMENLIRKYGWDVLVGYGLTECTLATHFTPKGQRRYPSVGVLMPFFEGKIVHQETGETIEPSLVGEICVRGHMVMKGYRDSAKETSDMIDEDGWLHTGDVGYYDKDGWLYIVDRKKELVKYKGFQVAPSELEGLLLTHPELTDAAVIGVPDDEAGELPKAFVVKKAGSNVTPLDIINFVKDQVSPYKQLRGGVVFVDVIPKLLSGKILRRVLRDQHNNPTIAKL